MGDHMTAEQLAELVVTAKRGSAAERSHGRRTRRIRPLDFSRPMKLSPPELRRFENTHARFCRDASIRLSSELRSPVELDVVEVGQLTWSAAMREAPEPAILALATAEPGGGGVLVSVAEPLLLTLVERLLGGAPTAFPASRNLTEIDTALAQRVFATLAETLSAAWEEFLGLTLTLTGIEAQHANVELVPPSEPSIAVTIEGRDQAGTAPISLLVPYSTIAGAGARVAGKAERDEAGAPGEEEGGTMRTAIGAIGVELRAEVGAVELTLGEVLALAPGDVVRLGPAGGEGLFGGGERLHRVRPGRAGSRRAVQILGSEEDR